MGARANRGRGGEGGGRLKKITAETGLSAGPLARDITQRVADGRSGHGQRIGKARGGRRGGGGGARQTRAGKERTGARAPWLVSRRRDFTTERRPGAPAWRSSSAERIDGASAVVDVTVRCLDSGRWLN